MKSKKYKSILSFIVVYVGVVLEHFDIMLVNLFATTMTGHFFQSSDGQDKLILGFVGYGISFLFRPLGAAIFGLIGDVAGRKQSMLLSLFVMSVATWVLGLTPSVHEIGFYSTLLFVVCRICQGMSVGGEYGAAMTYAYEFSREKKTLAGALVISATHVGGLAAAFLASRFVDEFQTAFIISGVLGLVSLGFRSYLVESHFEGNGKASFREVIRTLYPNRAMYRKAFLVGSSLVFVFYSSLIYLNEVIFQKNLASREEIFISNSFLLGLWIVLPAVLGYYTDRFKINYKKMMMLGALGTLLLIVPMLMIASHENTFRSFVMIQILISGIHSVFCFATPRYLSELFESKVRATGVALGYSLGASFTAALTPMICYGLISAFGSLLAIAIPILILSGLVAYQFYLESVASVNVLIVKEKFEVMYES